MKSSSLTLHLIVTCLCIYSGVQCKPPYKPDYDIGLGVLIYKGICQNQKVYLVNIDRLNAYQSGYSYPDTLTVRGIAYKNVVRLDSSRAAILDKKNINDKIGFDFTRSIRGRLPICTDLSAASVETVTLLSLGDANY